jgi:hypothetical protein
MLMRRTAKSGFITEIENCLTTAPAPHHYQLAILLHFLAYSRPVLARQKSETLRTLKEWLFPTSNFFPVCTRPTTSHVNPPTRACACSSLCIPAVHLCTFLHKSLRFLCFCRLTTHPPFSPGVHGKWHIQSALHRSYKLRFARPRRHLAPIVDYPYFSPQSFAGLSCRSFYSRPHFIPHRYILLHSLGITWSTTPLDIPSTNYSPSYIPSILLAGDRCRFWRCKVSTQLRFTWCRKRGESYGDFGLHPEDFHKLYSATELSKAEANSW